MRVGVGAGAGSRRSGACRIGAAVAADVLVAGLLVVDAVHAVVHVAHADSLDGAAVGVSFALW